MSWLLRLLGVRSPERDGGEVSAADWASDFAIDSEPGFVCSTCGRTDLPETGGLGSADLPGVRRRHQL